MEIVYVLAILFASAMMVGSGVVIALVLLVMTRHLRPKGFQSRRDKFAADADRLHRLMHPEDDKR